MSSRTSKSIINGQVAILYYVANILLGFYSRKIFIDYIGIEVLGLNQTAQNLLGFLNLAELGIGSAVAFTLYKPIAEKNYQSINEIIIVQGWLYRRIACFIGGGALVLMAFFPLIFKDIHLPLWYAYSSFGVFLYSSLLTYFVNYKQIILSASQLEYKITINYSLVMLVRVVIQIFAMKYLDNPYIWWLILQVIFATIASLNLNRAIRKTYPQIKCDLSKGKELIKKYSIITTKIKQTFFHSIGGFVLSQSSSLLIFAFVDLRMVAIYGNYMLIANCLRMLLNSAFMGIGAGVGNLVAEGNKTKYMRVFDEIFSIKFLVITVLLSTFYLFATPFMKIWIGDNLFLENHTLVILIFSLYIMLSRTTVDSYIAATGQFQDIWAPIVEAILNIGLSVLLGYYMGIDGVLLGALISLIVIVFLWKPFFLFRFGLKIAYMTYVKLYVIHILSFILSYFAVSFIYDLIQFSAPKNYIEWFAQALTYISIFIVVAGGILYIFSSGMRDFFSRFIKLIRK